MGDNSVGINFLKLSYNYIIETCERYNIKNYTINDDLSIDVKGDVYLNNKGLTELPLTFNIVSDYFSCSNNKLTNLKGVPRKCKYFFCYNNNLTSLEVVPDECGYFNCEHNNLTTLKGSPRCNYIIADYDKLNLDNEDLYVIESLANYYTLDTNLKDYLKIRQRNEIINTILGN